MDISRAMGNFHGQMEARIKENFNRMNFEEKVHIYGLTVDSLMELGQEEK